MCLITRKDRSGVSYITQVGTGNYNEKTAGQYTDLSYITADPAIGADAVEFFKNLAIGNLEGEYRHLLVAPNAMKDRILSLIDREIAKGSQGYIFLKLNSVTDLELIRKLRDASQAGVQVEMIVRGICCLLPGVAGETEHIHVTSIVGRYWSTPRIYLFGREGDELLYISSADFMTRNMSAGWRWPAPSAAGRPRPRSTGSSRSSRWTTPRPGVCSPTGPIPPCPPAPPPSTVTMCSWPTRWTTPPHPPPRARGPRCFPGCVQDSENRMPPALIPMGGGMIFLDGTAGKGVSCNGTILEQEWRNLWKRRKVYFTDFRTQAFGDGLPTKLKKLIRAAGIGQIDMDGKFVAIKLHFGELGNISYLRPNYARAVADVVKELGGKPFLTDCNTMYPGSRKNALEHLECAWQNGFTPLTVGCPILIGDGLKGTDDIAVPVAGGEYVKEAKIGRAIMDADVFISLTHFKGHEMTGFGGAIKNIGMGCGSRAGKTEQHSSGKPASTLSCAGAAAAASGSAPTAVWSLTRAPGKCM